MKKQKNLLLSTECVGTLSKKHSIVFKNYVIIKKSIGQSWGSYNKEEYSKYALINEAYCNACKQKFGKISMKFLKGSILDYKLFELKTFLAKKPSLNIYEEDFQPYINPWGTEKEAENFACRKDEFKHNLYFKIDNEGRKIFDLRDDFSKCVIFQKRHRKLSGNHEHKWAIPRGDIMITPENIVCWNCKRTFENVLSEYNSIPHHTGHCGDF